MRRILKIMFVGLFLILFSCEREENIGLVTITWAHGTDNPFAALFFGSGGKDVMWRFEVINCSDYVARDISFYLNKAKEPFYHIDSILPHCIKEFTRWEYGPKIVTTDTIIYQGYLGHKKFRRKFIPAHGISLKGKFEVYKFYE